MQRLCQRTGAVSFFIRQDLFGPGACFFVLSYPGNLRGSRVYRCPSYDHRYAGGSRACLHNISSDTGTHAGSYLIRRRFSVFQ